AEALTTKGYDVHVSTRRDRYDLPKGVHIHTADLLNEGEVIRLIGAVKPTHVLHLAWETAHGAYWTSQNNLNWVAATLGLARVAAHTGCERFVGVGTCAEYDWSEGGVVSELRSPLRAGTLY